MRLTELTDAAVVAEVGRRGARHRTERNLTQAEFAEAAGVSRSALQRLEGGESVQLTSFVKILRALDLLGELDAMLPEQIVLPVAAFERDQARARRRVRHSRAEGGSSPGVEPFKWGDEGGEG